jgi:hypothetical protein
MIRPRSLKEPRVVGSAYSLQEGPRVRSSRASHPLTLPQPTAPVPSRPDPRPVVLVIDDEPGVRTSVKMVLDGVCEVLEAPDGPTGIETVRTRDVDVCLLDVRLPGMEGISAGSFADASTPAWRSCSSPPSAPSARRWRR